MKQNKLKTIRNQLGLSQSALAQKLGMGKNGDRSIRRMEAGSLPISQETEEAIAALTKEELWYINWRRIVPIGCTLNRVTGRIEVRHG